ncbi:hypothetical protein BGZ61DRAFT_477597 [Ilyonectria robusta]|uniref:uncharacterized protein n=1 Tax=Ilyonectria robusta TaxID=1079257 RepID=UPI001E8D9645|nr:uncharacterized protein BGZ61DRAFT_477597 [Ilyonectria robusta]KAH8699615.1 hypothetical protein BGZ61DRAFT_477597 [Ilyonectria robusta]
MSLEVRLHGPRALGEIAIPLVVARCANRSTARRWRQIRDATPGGKSKQDRTSLRRRGTAAGDAQLDGKSARAGATFLAPHTVGESGEEALSHVLHVCGSVCASRERHCARFGNLHSEKFSMFASFGLEFDDTSQRESLGLFNTTHSELTETSNWAWDTNA